MKPYYSDERSGLTIYHGDALEVLRRLPAGSIQTVVTSPPYWGLRDYGIEGQLGLEKAHEEYVANMVLVFREVRRVLRDDGTLFLNLGDSYFSNAVSYDNDGREGQDYGGRDSTSESLGGERKDGQSKNNPDILCPVHGRIGESCEKIRRRKASQIDHSPIEDLSHEVTRNGGANADSAKTIVHADEQLPSFPKSTPSGSSVLHQVVSHPSDNSSSCQDAVVARNGDARLSFDKTACICDIVRRLVPSDRRKLGKAFSDLAYRHFTTKSLKPKDLCGIPWRVAFALRADGWYLRSDIIWQKPNLMPESVTDRPTKNHEYIFLLTKSARYFYDAEAIKEPFSGAYVNDSRHISGSNDRNEKDGYAESGAQNPKQLHRMFDKPMGTGRNKRTVWTIATQPFPGAHFATFPEELPSLCICAGTSERGACADCGDPWRRIQEKSRTFESGSGKSGTVPNGKNGVGLQGGGETGDVRRGPVVHSKTVGWGPTCKCPTKETRPCLVMDPFHGAGTSMVVAQNLGRRYVGIELKEEYIRMSLKRVRQGVML